MGDTSCPMCGAACRVVGKTTRHYEPVLQERLDVAVKALREIVALGGTPAGHGLPSPGMAYVIASNALALEDDDG